MKCRIQISTSNVLESPQSDGVETTCQIELDFNGPHAPDAATARREQVSQAMRACLEAVEQEICAGRGNSADPVPPHQAPARNSHGQASRPNGRRGRGRRRRRRHRDCDAGFSGSPATDSQRETINAICRRAGLDPRVAADNHHFQLGALTASQASMLIRQLSRLSHQPRLREYLRCTSKRNGAA